MDHTNFDDLFTKENVGGFDLAIRAFAGSAGTMILALGWVQKPVSWIVAAIAFYGLYTAITRHCLLWAILGISTKSK